MMKQVRSITPDVRMNADPSCRTCRTRRWVLLAKAAVVILLMSELGLQPLWAARVSASRARKAVDGWRKRVPHPLGQKLGVDIINVRTYSDSNGVPLYHVATLKPSGFVVMSAEDQVEPVIALSAEGSYDPSPDNPLTVLLDRDLRARIGEIQKTSIHVSPRKREKRLHRQEQWRRLESQDEPDDRSYAAPLMEEPDDVRVEPFVKSRWNQGNANGQACFNYFTPNRRNGTTQWVSGDSYNWSCGCVATAMAQLMRYHQYPTQQLIRTQHKVRVSWPGWYQEWNQTLFGGHPWGGSYRWDLMVYVPDSWTPWDQRGAIGGLCRDAAVAVNMEFGEEGSGANVEDAADALEKTFQYAQAVYFGEPYRQIPSEVFPALVNPNLDARYPVILGICEKGKLGGHTILVDGYGYEGNISYHHLNLGWSGSGDIWYNLPTVEAGYTFNVVDECVYNVLPYGTGEIVSGRVTNEWGWPIEGVSITAVDQDGITYTATTDTQGIYALVYVRPNTNLYVYASHSQYVFGSSPRITAVGQSMDKVSCGNRWAVNFSAGGNEVLTLVEVDPGIEAGLLILLEEPELLPPAEVEPAVEQGLLLIEA